MERISQKLLNTEALLALEAENELLADAAEREAREKLIEGIWEALWDYDIHMLRYEYRMHMQALAARGVRLLPASRDTAASGWDRLFAASVTAEAKQRAKHYNDQYKWHLFSFRLLNALEGDAARRAFDAQEKDEALLFYQHEQEAYRVQNAAALRAADLDVESDMGRADLYVYSPEGRWTYVKTHEDACGPYFYRLP